jgi:pimeloyl-ACP methyl ester carboxylesterase
MPNSLKPPNPLYLLLEARAALDLLSTAVPLALPLLKPLTPTAQPRNIMVLPGLTGGDLSTWPLRRHLADLGHHVEGWGLGRNLAGANIAHTAADIPAEWDFELNPSAPYRGEASVVMLCDRALARVRARSAELKSPLTLIGWSLGGYIAREVARLAPDCVNFVITLGSPVLGGPKYTAAAPLFRLRGQDMDWMEQQIARRNDNPQQPIRAPILAIISPTDGVVSPGAAQDASSPNVRTVEVNAAHLGLGNNAKVWAIVAHALAEQAV